MPTLGDQILELLADRPGKTDREITNAIKGRGEPQQGVNQECRHLANQGVLERRKRDDGLIGNYPTDKKTKPGAASISRHSTDRRRAIGDATLSEDEVKTALKAWLEDRGWTTEIAWGRARGIDIEATKGKVHWIIEVKGCGSLSAMRVNYFLGVLGETLQRMDDPTALYSIAFPDMKQFRGLWDRLPSVAKQRTGITALFVGAQGGVSMID
ncbi:MAG: MarR family transcriptional regulator [Acidobacteriota bacterium]